MKHLFLWTLIFSSLQSFAFEAIDSIYNNKVKTVQLYPFYNIQKDVILPAVIKVNDKQKLRLEFDILENDYQDLTVKIFLCDADWKLSPTNELNYLEEYNEFDIFDRELSFSTKAFYVHYSFDVPKVTLSGNYILTVSNTDSNQPILSKRFMVAGERVKIIRSEFNTSSNISAIQQVNFNVDYSNSDVLNPMQNSRVFIRKNGRFDQLRGPIKPTFYKAYENLVQYYSIDGSIAYNGGDSFRKFDIRSSEFSGYNVANVNTEKPITEITLHTDETRRHSIYSNQQDIKGSFLIDHYEFDDGAINSDYFLTLFSLKHPKTTSQVYIYGQLTDWKLKEEFRMHYIEEKQTYVAAPLLKQGYYNYEYVTFNNGKINEIYFEGNHREVNNFYEVFVYYKIPGQTEESLIGYEVFPIFDF